MSELGFIAGGNCGPICSELRDLIASAGRGHEVTLGSAFLSKVHGLNTNTVQMNCHTDAGCWIAVCSLGRGTSSDETWELSCQPNYFRFHLTFVPNCSLAQHPILLHLD